MSTDDQTPSAEGPPQADPLDAVYDQLTTQFDAGLQNVLNTQWDDAVYHFDKVGGLLPQLPDDQHESFAKLLAVMRKMASGTRQSMEAHDESDLEAALGLLSESRQTLLDLGESQTDFAKSPNYRQTLNGLDMQIVGITLNLATRSGRIDEAATLAAQRDKLVEEAIQISGDDQSLGYSMRGLKIWMQAIPIIQASSQASVRLNLEDQKRYIQDARQLLKQAEEVLDKVQADDVLFDAPRKFARGTALLLAAQEAYASVLYSAITGDVTRQDIELLRAADKQLLDAGQRMIAASPVLGAALLNTGALKASIDVQREITRNLRILCERSLSPKEISRSASPRLAVYFLGTFLVLLFASKVSGLIAQLDAPALGFLILMSFIASLVGTFGFEALRCPYPTLHRRVGGPPAAVPLLDSPKGIFAPKPQPAVDKK